jgi:hypothetical protein
MTKLLAAHTPEWGLPVTVTTSDNSNCNHVLCTMHKGPGILQDPQSSQRLNTGSSINMSAANGKRLPVVILSMHSSKAWWILPFTIHAAHKQLKNGPAAAI